MFQNEVIAMELSVYLAVITTQMNDGRVSSKIVFKTVGKVSEICYRFW